MAKASGTANGPVICGLSRTALKDIDRCWEAIEVAQKRRIHTFIATSDIHMRRRLRDDHEQVLAEATGAVAHARTYTDDMVSPEDASRSEFEFMCQVLQAAVDAGAAALNIPDTVGLGIPARSTDDGWQRSARSSTATSSYSAHCHNDLGLAVANSLAAVMQGARQVECAVNGIGERAGNAALEEIVMALRTRAEWFKETSQGSTLRPTSDPRSWLDRHAWCTRLTGYRVDPNEAVVGVARGPA